MYLRNGWASVAQWRAAGFQSQRTRFNSEQGHKKGIKMTMHYGETVTANEIIQGWQSHGEAMPLAYATISQGDHVAYNCWVYLHHLKMETKPILTPEEFFQEFPEDRKEELVQILKDTINRFHELTKE